MIQDIVYKICYYAGDDHRNFSKLKQYLLLFRKENQDARGKPKGNEVALRKHGGVKMLMKFLSCVSCTSDGTWTTGYGKPEVELEDLPLVSPQDTLRQVISIILNLLGNCFVLDVGAVKEAEKRDFVGTLSRILVVGVGGTENLNEEKNILSRCLRCIANLATYSNNFKGKIVEKECGPRVMNVLDNVNAVLERVLAESQDRKAADVIIEKNEESIVVEGARVIRMLCCNNAQTQQDLVTQDGILRIGRFLKYSYNQTVYSEVLKALALLTNTSKRLPAQTINSLSCIEDKEGNILYRVVEAAKTCSTVAKVFNPALICLVQLSKYPNLQNTLINVGVFDVTLKLIGMFDDVGSLEKLVTILVQLTQPGANSYRLERTRVDQDFTLPNVVFSCCHDLGETLKVLRKKELSRFHLWILHLYVNLYGSKLKDIEAKGLLTVLLQRLEEEVGSLSMDRLNALMLTVESNVCPVHCAGGKQCPFMPKYSCRSPSYQEVASQTSQQQPDPATIVNMLNSTFVSSCNLSPPASPVTQKDFSEELFSPSSSPQHVFGGSTGGYSPNVISSDDETMDDDYEDTDTPSVRKRKFSSSGDEDEEAADTKRLKEASESMDTTTETEVLEPENDIKEKSKKIVYILGIVLQCSHLDRLPKEVLNFLPYILETVWRGRMSVEKGPNCQALQQPTEDTLPLSRLCFQRSFKILLKICTDIHSFPKLVDDSVVQMIFRIFVYNLTAATKETETKIRDFRIEYSNKIMESLVGLCGDDNTIGYRQGELRKKCTEALSFPATHSIGVLAIPLLYSNNSPLFMEFERCTSGWNSVLHILKHVDDLPATTFNSCILALSSVAKAKGAKWIEPKLAEDRKLMHTEDVAFINSQLCDETEDYVELEMSDTSSVKLPKKFFIDASPVFAAMFGGTFREGREQKVLLNHVKSRTLRLLVGQMLMDNRQADDVGNVTKPVFDPEERDIITLLELVELADQYLLFELKERVLNTLILGYFCPHSASVIFKHSLSMNSGNPNKDSQPGTSAAPSRSNLNTDLTYLVLKYLLVGEHIGYSLRMTTFKNVFDIGSVELILQNIAKILRGE